MICDEEDLTFYLGTHREKWLTSADSMAWSYRGRRTPTACGSPTHKNEANCMPFALGWRERVLRSAKSRPWQPALFEGAP